MPLERSLISSNVPHSARIWNYWLGGKDCYEIDRQVGDQIVAANPHIVHTARAQRAFLGRSVEHLVRQAGIRQFLDVGTGLPTADNTHEVAQRAAADARIVYVDHDPIVLAHAEALLTSTPEGTTHYIDADLRDPERILADAARTLDFTRPVALVLLGIAAHITDDSAYAIVDRLVAGLPSGSYLVFCDSTAVINPAEQYAMVEQWNDESDNPRVNRSPEGLARFFEGLELLDPGLLSVSRWRPTPTPPDGTAAAPTTPELPPEVDSFGAVARKP